MDLNRLRGPDFSHLHNKLILQPLLKLKRQRSNKICFIALLRLWYSKCVPWNPRGSEDDFRGSSNILSYLCSLCQNLNSSLSSNSLNTSFSSSALNEQMIESFLVAFTTLGTATVRFVVSVDTN